MGRGDVEKLGNFECEWEEEGKGEWGEELERSGICRSCAGV